MKKVNTKLVAASLAAIAVLGYCLIVNAGNLEPSAPPASTMKTLNEVEPRIPINSDNTPGDSNYMYIISSSGSYYLISDVVRACPRSHFLIFVRRRLTDWVINLA